MPPIKYLNPKQRGSNLVDCKPQLGLCSVGCNQCFYNRPGASFVPIKEQLIPPVERTKRGVIVRMNSVHDSNIAKELVLTVAKKYDRVFFNTAIADFDFPGPVVYTANREEEQMPDMRFLKNLYIDNLMFIRLRVSSSNLNLISSTVKIISEYTNIPIVLTFMYYYTEKPPEYCTETPSPVPCCYIWKKSHTNENWCATKMLKRYVLKRMKKIAGDQVTICGTLDSNYCKDCRVCEGYFWIKSKQLKEM